jgi:hypothetical protein
MAAVDRLRDKARDYELSTQAALERGAPLEAQMFTCISIALFEAADCLDETTETDGELAA